MKKPSARTLMTGITVVVAVCAYRVGKAIAAGIPTNSPLVYSGVLLDNGQPVTAKTSISAGLYTTSGSFSSNACTQVTQSITPDAAGRFQITLDATCVDAVHNNPNLFVGIQVGSASIPMTALTAVPYAVEAQGAATASDGGALQSQVAQALRPVVTNPATGVSTSVNGLPCGLAGPSSGSISSSSGAKGYAGAKALCEAVANCSATAHLCSGQELIRASSVGITIPGASNSSPPWYASGAAVETASTEQNDCEGYTSALSTLQGSGWGATGPIPSACNAPASILCCD